jgi:cytochrome c5
MRFLVLACFVICACEDKKPARPKTQLQAETEPVKASDPAADAKEIFNSRCAACHGIGGKGDGAAGAALNPKPRDMTDGAWQKSVNDDHIKKVIVEGGASVGKSPLMAANPDLKDKPEVLAEIVKHVRSFAK